MAKMDEMTALVFGKPCVLGTLQDSKPFQLGHDSFPIKMAPKNDGMKKVPSKGMYLIGIKIIVPEIKFGNQAI